MGFRTQANVDKLRPSEGKSDAYVWDDECPGLSIRLQGAAKRWVVWYAANGKRRRVTLGAVAGMPLKEARIQAGRIVGGARDGKDALAERAAARAKSADTLGKLVDIYLERRAKPRQRIRTYVEVERYLRKRWSPLHDRPLDSITRRDIASRLEEIRVDHGPISANRARTYLGSAFTWAMRQGLTEANPVLGTEPPAAETASARVLTPAELTIIWRICGKAGEFGTIVRLLMLTGQRREEVAGMGWPELDLDRALWTIPSARTKNKLEHEVPLPHQAVALLPKKREGRDFVFGRGKKGSFSGYSRSKARLVEAIAKHRAHEAGHDPEDVDLEEWQLQGWTLHDLRRTADTVMHEIGIEPHIVEAVLNHVSGHKGGVAGTYNRARYREPKRIALQHWADWLEATVAGKEPVSNVAMAG
jgi:integrase